MKMFSLAPLRFRLFPRFVFFLTLIAVVPVATVSTLIVRINDDSLQKQVQRFHIQLAESLANRMDERLSTLQAQLFLGISALQSPNLSWAGRQDFLRSLLDSSEQFGIISVVNNFGQEVMKVYNPVLEPDIREQEALISHRTFPLFLYFKKTGKQSVRATRRNGKTFAEIYLPFETPAGLNAMYAKASLNDLSDVISQKAIGLTGYAYVVGADGELLTSPPAAAGPNIQIIKDPSMVKTALMGSLGAREFRDENGIRWVGASAPINKLGGAVLTQQKRDEAYADVIKGKRTAALNVLITILIILMAAYLLAGSLVKPLLAITRVAQDVDLARGAFPEPVRITSGDEIQDLAQTFNKMIEKLKGYADMQVEKLIIEQKKTEAIIFSIEDGLIMTDYQGKIQLINHQAKNILQIPGDTDALGQPLWKFLPSPDLKTAFVDVLTKPEAKKAIEVKLPREGKDNFFALKSEHVRPPNKQETLGVVTVIHDITLEKELDSMKEEFLHSITHDLRNPLTAIRGFIRLFQSGQTGVLTDLQRKMFDTMDKASLRLMTMVNDILDLARLEAGRLKLNLASIRIEDISNRVIELFTPQARTNTIQLSIETANGPLPPVTADPALMERVFTNLIGNAMKFTPDGGTITIKLAASDDAFIGSVRDSGEGIPKAYLDAIFDKFKQVEGRFKGGAGLGLTICKRIVEAHGGRIWAESDEGKGSIFTFTIPRNLVIPQQEKAA
ncbi:MAG: HAMP domain-containing protein [Elusimicrobia bacterium]|nr:HAMP domain-containing protein [Candidatus Obscuribacterium magneticum]